MSKQSQLKQTLLSLITNRGVRVAIQAAISIAILVTFVQMIGQAHLIETFQTIDTITLVTSFALIAGSIALAAFRWKVLLAALGIPASFLYLLDSYLIGMFFSLFLPTGTGGDVVRAYDVGRTYQSYAKAALATLQERLISLGMLLIIGLLSSFTVLNALPPLLVIAAFGLQIGGIIICMVVLFPQWMFYQAQRIWQRFGHSGFLQRVSSLSIVQRIWLGIQPLANVAPIQPALLVQILVSTLMSGLLIIAAHAVIGWGLGMILPFATFCVVIPMIFVVRILPISFGGIGVGEGALVGLLQLFGIASEQSLTLGLVALAVQLLFPIIGGIMLVIRMARGAWVWPVVSTAE